MSLEVQRPIGRPCATCTSPMRADIESRLLDGATLYATSRQFGVSRSSLRLHARSHVAEEVAFRIQLAAGQTPTLIALRLGDIASETSNDVPPM
jgi:hypothetical protein